MTAGYGDTWYDDPTISQDFADVADAPGYATDAGETSQELSDSTDGYPYTDTTTGDEPDSGSLVYSTHPDATAHPSPIRGTRVIGRESDGSHPMFRTRAAGGQGLEYDVPETVDVLTAALSQLDGGPTAFPVRTQTADVWNAGQVQVGTVAVRLAPEDTSRTRLTIRNTDPSAAPIWIANGSHVNAGGAGSIQVPVGATITLTHTGEVWAIAPTGAPTQVFQSVAVPASTATVVVPGGSVGPITVSNVGPGGMQFNMGAAVLTSGSAVGQTYSFPAGYVTPQPITAYDGTASTATVSYGTANTNPVQVNVDQEKIRQE